MRDPSSINEASRQTLIEVLPPVLVIHLKRFLYDPAAGGMAKIGKPIQFTPELQIPFGTISIFLSPWAADAENPRLPGLVGPDVMAPIARQSKQPTHYTLYGVLYHHGVSASEGHYTIDVLHPNGNNDSREGWLHINDEIVSAVRHEDVFRTYDEGRGDDRCPYMLFYCRKALTGTL